MYIPVPNKEHLLINFFSFFRPRIVFKIRKSGDLLRFLPAEVWHCVMYVPVLQEQAASPLRLDPLTAFHKTNFCDCWEELISHRRYNFEYISF
jgi:hypothetical protein